MVRKYSRNSRGCWKSDGFQNILVTHPFIYWQTERDHFCWLRLVSCKKGDIFHLFIISQSDISDLITLITIASCITFMTDTSVPLVCKPYLTNKILSTARITMTKILKEREREKKKWMKNYIFR